MERNRAGGKATLEPLLLSPPGLQCLHVHAPGVIFKLPRLGLRLPSGKRLQRLNSMPAAGLSGVSYGVEVLCFNVQSVVFSFMVWALYSPTFLELLTLSIVRVEHWGPSCAIWLL